ncbi:hypothetical protein [Methylocystis rosea]|uniref:Uncharacterized protein n=1 Tax=Methylocystis rosea TaxID=173366 RepID=A0A3G8M4T4_9HYPH|nr:hypothetical protein [Methylocystis rosea]AZG76335.1 hypothetical protein EHO51_06105 [Methylocystis rosea]
MNYKQIARWVGVCISAVSVLFAILTYLGVWNEWRGDNALADVAARFDSSYSKDAGRPVRPGDNAWPALMRVIASYSNAQLPTGREPKVFARFAAIASAQNDRGEWTAPTTSVVLLYREWPAPGTGEVPPRDFVIVGTIGDLHNWIQWDKSDFDYFTRNILFGALSAVVGLFLALPDDRKRADGGS